MSRAPRISAERLGSEEPLDGDGGARDVVSDPNGAMLTGDAPGELDLERRETWDRAAEHEHNQKRFGETYRERYGRRRQRCVNYCLSPGQRSAHRCPTCYGKVETRPIDAAPEDAVPEWQLSIRLRFWARFWLLAGYAAFGLSWPWRVDRERIVTALRDELAHLVIEVTEPPHCPVCEAADAAPDLKAAP
jgi:hypothetical protein